MLGLPGAALPHGRELVETGDARLARSSSSSWEGAGRDRGCQACQGFFFKDGSLPRQGDARLCLASFSYIYFSEYLFINLFIYFLYIYFFYIYFSYIYFFIY